jgi:hypothetical protein
MSKKSTIAVPRYELPDGTVYVRISGDVELARSTEPGHPVQIIGGDTDLTSHQAREMAAYLAGFADEADELADAAVEELASILLPHCPGMAPAADGDYRLAVCREYARAAIDAGWRKS